MPIPTPFHERTAALCVSLFWKDWAGYHAVRSYDTAHEREYFTLHHAAGVIDVSPLYKYEVRGPDAAPFLSYVTVKDIRRLKAGRVTYLCWCDDHGKVADDGTVAHLGKDHYRVTAAEPAGAWLAQRSAGFRVQIEDVSASLAALSLQGPTSRAILKDVTAGADLDALRYFGVTEARLSGIPVHISRTGYTGELGFEIWIPAAQAVAAYDALMAAGRAHRIGPVGLDAMDMTRIEAGYIMNGVDYFSAHHCLLESRKSTPYELGLGRTVDLDREPFVGQAALKAEVARGPAWAIVGLVYDWDEFEALFNAVGLPPQVPAGAWRVPVPVYDEGGRQAGYATSGTWSPLLKKNLALASVRAAHAAPGTKLKIEVTVEFHRKLVTTTVTKTPFYDPERKRR
jgi:aminomethyltransferase